MINRERSGKNCKPRVCLIVFIVVFAFILFVSAKQNTFAASIAVNRDLNVNLENSKIIPYDVNNAIVTVLGKIDIEAVLSDGTIRTISPNKVDRVHVELLNDIKTRIHTSLINNTLLTTIPLSDYTFDYNESFSPIHLRVKKLSPLGKCLLSNEYYSNMYRLLDNDSEYIKLINGIYNVEYLGSNIFYAIDANGDIIKGFVVTSGQSFFDLTESNDLSMHKSNDPYIFYCNDSGDQYSGMFWCSSVVFNNFLYSFDDSGRLKSVRNSDAYQDDTPVLTGTWEYNLDIQKWRFSQTDANGNRVYLKNGFYRIKHDDGKSYYYLFDLDGNMRTGLVKYASNTYYLQERGNYIGAMYVGNITLNKIPYTFDADGKMISAMGKDMKVTGNKYYSK